MPADESLQYATKLESRELNFVLQSKLKELSHILSWLGIYDNKKLDLKVLNFPSELKNYFKNIILLESLDFVAAKSGVIAEIITEASKMPLAVDFVIPINIQEKDNWILVILSDGKTDAKNNKINYKLTIVDPLYLPDNKYHCDIIQATKSFVRDMVNLSCEQQLRHKESPKWSMGHILINNAIRLIEGQKIIPGKFFTAEYKQGLSVEYAKILQTYPTDQKLRFIFELKKQLQLLINYASLSLKMQENKRDNNQLVENLNHILSSMPDLESDLIKYLQLEAEYLSDIYAVKLLVDDFHNQVKVILATITKYHALHLKYLRADEQQLLHIFFHLLENYIAAVTLCQDVKSIVKGNHNNKGFIKNMFNARSLRDDFVKTEDNIVRSLLREISLDEIVFYANSVKKLFSIMKGFLDEVLFKNKEKMKKLSTDFRQEITQKAYKISEELILWCNSQIKVCQGIQRLRNFFENLPNKEVSKKLISSEVVANTKRLTKITHNRNMQKNAKALILKSDASYIEETKTQDIEDEQKLIQTLVGNCKKNISQYEISWEEKLNEVSKLEAIIVRKKLLFENMYKLEVASCLVSSVGHLKKSIENISRAKFYHKMDSIVLEASMLQDKVAQLLTEPLNDNDQIIKINALVVIADLYSIRCFIFKMILQSHKYDLVYTTFNGYLRVNRDLELSDVDKRLVLINQYIECINNMKIYISCINSLLNNLSGFIDRYQLLLSLEEYEITINDYKSVLAHVEAQNILADQQREQFKQDLNNGFVKKKPFGVTLSNAALVQKQLREQKTNAQDLYFYRRQIYNECEEALYELKKHYEKNLTVQKEKDSNSAEKNNQDLFFSWRPLIRRTNSFNGYSKLDDFLLNEEVLYQRRCSL